jgi:hypothetical protein
MADDLESESTLITSVSLGRCYHHGKASMRRLFESVVVVVFILAQPAQSRDRSKPRDNAQGKYVLRLNERLRNPKGDSHDDYASAIYIGNEQTVPLLLERLRRDYGATEPIPPPGRQFGFVCTQVHLVEALRTITNTDQGMFYPRWAKWWDANHGLPRDTWIRNGFFEAGLHPVSPADERFGLELIELLAGKCSYRAINAQRLLARERVEQRAAWVATAARSEKPQRRLGALKVLVEIDKGGAQELIRTLTNDSDREISDLAVSTLRERQQPPRR